MELPYTLVLDPVTGKGAAYTSNHRLIAAEASRDLVEFAQARHTRRVAWDPKQHKPMEEWRPLPAWATPEVLARSELLWVRDGNSDAQHLADLPRK